MARFIQLDFDKHTDENKIYYDVSDVTGIRQDENSIRFYDKNGECFGYQVEKGFDASALLDDLKKAGIDMIALPYRDHDGTKRMEHYINPQAVTFINTSSEAEGSLGVIVGVEGMGWAESFHASKKELNNLVDTTRKTGKSFVEFTPDEASSRWVKPGTLYVDPTAVERIAQDAGQQIHTLFRNSGSLDIQPPRKVIDQSVQRLMHMTGMKDSFNSQNAVHIEEMRRDIENEHLAKIAHKMAGSSDLVKVPSDNGQTLYVRRDDVSSISKIAYKNEINGYQLYIEFKHPSKGRNNDAFMSFKSEQAREAAVKLLTQRDKPKQDLKFKR